MKTTTLARALSLVLSFSAIGQTLGIDSPLRINHVLGSHRLADGVIIEIYATTQGEMNYSFSINGHQKGGSSLAKNTGEDTYFFWDQQTRQLWVITPDVVTKNDYSIDQSTTSSSHPLSQATSLNPPTAVQDIIHRLLK